MIVCNIRYETNYVQTINLNLCGNVVCADEFQYLHEKPKQNTNRKATRALAHLFQNLDQILKLFLLFFSFFSKFLRYTNNKN